MTQSNAGGLPPIRRRTRTPATPPAATSAGWGAGSWGDESAGPRSVGRSSSGSASWGAVSHAPTTLERPNLVLVLALVASSLLTIGVALLGTTDQVILSATILVGMFGGVMLLGLARLDANRKRSGGRFTDWSIESSKVATGLFALGWLAGLISLWRLALDLSRIFT